MTEAALCYRTLSNGLGGGSKTEAVAISDGYRNNRVAYGIIESLIDNRVAYR